jgi:hypothetical protein
MSPSPASRRSTTCQPVRPGRASRLSVDRERGPGPAFLRPAGCSTRRRSRRLTSFAAQFGNSCLTRNGPGIPDLASAAVRPTSIAEDWLARHTQAPPSAGLYRRGRGAGPGPGVITCFKRAAGESRSGRRSTSEVCGPVPLGVIRLAWERLSPSPTLAVLGPYGFSRVPRGNSRLPPATSVPPRVGGGLQTRHTLALAAGRLGQGAGRSGRW